ncbi:MAG: hypothetical protein IKS55_08140, partial [Oscillospiraceae bacterium]|nr:hypothetical protein [Oscillospiraceae bacterium]
RFPEVSGKLAHFAARRCRWKPTLLGFPSVFSFAAEVGQSGAAFSLAAKWNRATPLPEAEEGDARLPQRSKNTRISVSPQCFSGTARRNNLIGS